nr:unnamed protein product [Callosobruchus analis]
MIPEKLIKTHFLSDGPVTQHRNKTTFYILACQLYKIFPNIRQFTGNFHEAGHGKGEPDGVGAVCKRTADKSVLMGTDVCSLDLLGQIIEKNCPSIKLFIITDNDIEQMESIIKANEQSTIPFHGTLQLHQVCEDCSLPNKSTMKQLSYFCSNECCFYYKLGKPDYLFLKSKLSLDEVFSDSDPESQVADCRTASFGKKSHAAEELALVKLSANKIEYRYVAVCTGDQDDEEDIKVIYLKICDEEGTLF